MVNWFLCNVKSCRLSQCRVIGLLLRKLLSSERILIIANPKLDLAATSLPPRYNVQWLTLFMFDLGLSQSASVYLFMFGLDLAQSASVYTSIYIYI